MSRKNVSIVTGLVCMMLMICIVWSVKAVKRELPYVDQWTRGFVEIIGNSFVYEVFRWITEFGSKSFLLPFTIFMSFFLWYFLRNWLAGFLFGAGTLGSHLFNSVIKELVERERPRILIEANAEGYSFPSGHAMTSLVCYGLLAYFLMKKITSQKVKISIKIAFSLLIFLIGISRYVINVHYLTDVLAGFIIGGGFLAGMIFLYGFIEKKKWKTIRSQTYK